MVAIRATKAVAGLGVLALLAVVLAPGRASAQQFTSTAGKILKMSFDRGALVVKWDETGATSNNVSYDIRGTASATYGCVTPTAAALCAPDPVASSMSFTLDPQSGTVRQSAAVQPPGPSCSCAGTLVLYEVDFGQDAFNPDMQICDTTASVCAPIGAGYFSATFCDQNKLASCPTAP